MDIVGETQVPGAKTTTTWLEAARGAPGPRYVAIVDALRQAIREGDLQPGDRLPPQRTAAGQLGVDLTTVTRAYATAREQGLLEGAVGRGSFVRAPASTDDAGLVDLSMNLPPQPQGLSLGDMLRRTVDAILQHADPAILMAYHPDFGARGQRAAGVRWLEPTLGPISPDRLLVCPGAQSALAAILAATCRPGDAVVADALTYPGLIGAARMAGLRLLACPADDEGMRPEALERLCAGQRPKAIYLVPTMHNPTAVTLSAPRREALAGIAEAADAWIIEDDPYSRLMDAPPPALASFAPERTFHVATLAKCLSPGLRIAYLACPPAWMDKVSEALRATALMPAPLMAALATRWIQEGDAWRLLDAVRDETRARRALAAAILPQAHGGPESIHVWLPLPNSEVSTRLQLAGRAAGMAIATAEAFAVETSYPSGARISLGGPSRRSVLERALIDLSGLVGRSSLA
jgi:DNA-binding transcriptional MocR family regulator